MLSSGIQPTEPTVVSACLGSATELVLLNLFLEGKGLVLHRSLKQLSNSKLVGRSPYANTTACMRMNCCCHQTVCFSNGASEVANGLANAMFSFQLPLPATNHCSRFVGMTDCLGPAARSCPQNGFNSPEWIAPFMCSA